jgi:hypothetical protein
VRAFGIVAFCATVGLLAGCASSPPQLPTVPIALTGALDLTRPGVHFRITGANETLECSAHSSMGKLPETLSLPLSCDDGKAGTLNLTKSPDLRGAVTFADGTIGEVTFVPLPPTAPRVAAAPSTTVAASPPAHVRTYQTYSPSRSSTGYVRSHYRRSTYVRGYYRNGRYVSGHYRRGSHVRGHYRRR